MWLNCYWNMRLQGGHHTVWAFIKVKQMWLNLLHLRHDLILSPSLHQHSIHKQRHGGEAVLGPLPPFVKADPACYWKFI